jgi:hypothetical protein
MGLAFTIATASIATSLSEHAIEIAIRERWLRARHLDGTPIILRTDLQVWLESLPDLY